MERLPANHKKRALNLIILFGLVSLFGDIVYEGARAVNGPFLKVLAANAATVGVIAGAGEFLGYVLRLLSGYISDKTKSYWLLTFLGYGMLMAVPLLSLAGIWQIAAVFIILERIGKAIRSPARDTILSQASSQVGTGFGFGLHEAMDQIGAIIGPLFFTTYFIVEGRRQVNLPEYQKAYVFLWIPFLLVMACLFIAYKRVPKPEILETSAHSGLEHDKLSKIFWLYTLFTFITTAGFCNFLIIAFHFKAKNVFSDAQIPLLYAMAMGVDAVIALAIGKYYDILKIKANNKKSGLNTLIAIPLASLLIPVFAFSRNYILIIIGVCFWGIVMGIHETIMRSAIADLTSLRKRGTGYGIFNATYGLAVLAGSSLLGFLYDVSMSSFIIVAVFLEILALGVFFLVRREVFVK